MFTETPGRYSVSARADHVHTYLPFYGTYKVIEGGTICFTKYSVWPIYMISSGLKSHDYFVL